MKERKKELRRQIAHEKTRYSVSTLHALSAEALAQLEASTAFREAETVLIYHSMKDEVYTHSFIDKWSRTKKIILPVVVGNILELRMYTGPNDLQVGSYGIAEPIGEPFTDFTAIHLVVVPGVAFDAKGHRLGRGKGYYDKLLPLIPAPKFGICFPFQFVEEVPTEPFDICMDAVITGK